MAIALLVAIAALYFLPLIIAVAKKTDRAVAIGALNFFLGWTFLGWVAALVWALAESEGAKKSANDTEPLAYLVFVGRPMAEIRRYANSGHQAQLMRSSKDDVWKVKCSGVVVALIEGAEAARLDQILAANAVPRQAVIEAIDPRTLVRVYFRKAEIAGHLPETEAGMDSVIVSES